MQGTSESPVHWFHIRKDSSAIQADGFSMNQAKIGKSKRNIEPGDYAIVDGDVKAPEDGQYVLSVIDGLANIKKFHLDRNTIGMPGS